MITSKNTTLYLGCVFWLWRLRLIVILMIDRRRTIFGRYNNFFTFPFFIHYLLYRIFLIIYCDDDGDNEFVTEVLWFKVMQMQAGAHHYSANMEVPLWDAMIENSYFVRDAMRQRKFNAWLYFSLCNRRVACKNYDFVNLWSLLFLTLKSVSWNEMGPVAVIRRANIITVIWRFIVIKLHTCNF